MLVVLKIIHMFCLLGGGAAMIGNGILIRKIIVSGGPPVPMVAETMKRIGMIGLSAIVLFWITGVLMLIIGHIAIGWALAVKLIAAAVVLALVALVNVQAARAARAGVPPDLARIKTLSTYAAVAVAVAVVFAVIAFT